MILKRKIIPLNFTNHSYIVIFYRVTLQVACNMNLKEYPFDNQICYIRIASCNIYISFEYSRTVKYLTTANLFADVNDENKLLMRWFSVDPITRNEEIDLPEMQLVSIEPTDCGKPSYFAFGTAENKPIKKGDTLWNSLQNRTSFETERFTLGV